MIFILTMSQYADEAGLEGGDSGSPSFIVWNEQLTLMGTHFAISSDIENIRQNIDSFILYYLDDLNTAMYVSDYAVSVIKAIFTYVAFPGDIRNNGIIPGLKYKKRIKSNKLNNVFFIVYQIVKKNFRILAFSP
ncbi:MAG: hypothetical protein KAJ14_01950 [Candidatus Omnitrophica bacterium]|nr:hypothetical protein [Candidatus Omnitrophota bacterium]